MRTAQPSSACHNSISLAVWSSEAQHAQPAVVGAQSHSYRTYATPGELVTQYLAYLADVKARVQDPSYALNGAIYTEARPLHGAGKPCAFTVCYPAPRHALRHAAPPRSPYICDVGTRLPSSHALKSLRTSCKNLQHFLCARLQVSDVESEVNGWATYDRILKIDDAAVRRIAAAHADLLAAAT